MENIKPEGEPKPIQERMVEDALTLARLGGFELEQVSASASYSRITEAQKGETEEDI